MGNLIDLKIVEKYLKSKQIRWLLAYGKKYVVYSTIAKIFDLKSDFFDLNEIVFDIFSNHNLATYLIELLKNREGVVGIFVKPCDAKSIIELIRENKIARDRIVIFSMPCRGIVNKEKLFSFKNCETERINDIDLSLKNIKIVFDGRTLETQFSKISENKCLSCQLSSSPIFDVSLGESVPPSNGELHVITPSSEKRKRAFWLKQYKKCIRCGACKNVCPMCYCENCILERTIPNIVGKKVTPFENGAFLQIRAIHLAGRCIGCGMCSSVCPVAIPHEEFHMPCAIYVADTFGFKPGLNSEGLPLFSCANMEEKEDFK